MNSFVNGVSAFSDLPNTTSILGAAKITGRTAGGITVGMLDALTNRESAEYVPMPGGPTVTQQVEPLSNYFVGRAKKELREGATTIGGMFTSVARQMNDTILSDRLRSHAEAVGIDWNHQWSHRDYDWMGSLAASNVGGSTQAIGLTQQSSAHYFQRPDRRVTSDGLFGAAYDSNATSLRGYGLYTRVAKNSGNWIWETAQNWRSPGFETNDLSYPDRGRLQVDELQHWSQLESPGEAGTATPWSSRAASSNSTTTVIAPISRGRSSRDEFSQLLEIAQLLHISSGCAGRSPDAWWTGGHA